MQYLITQSLLSSWLRLWTDFEKYIFDNSEKTAADYQADAYEDFLRVLRREPTETTEAMQKGIDFENLVTDICNGIDCSAHKWYAAAAEVAEEVKGGQFQLAASAPLRVAGMDFLLYGRLDVLKAGRVIDIKYTSRYEVGKFFDSPQHPMYIEIVPEAYEFLYLISNGTRVWREEYRREECRPIADFISEFVAYLDTTGLLPLYKEKWAA